MRFPAGFAPSRKRCASSRRVWMSSLRYALRRWYSTVFGVTNSACAISRLLCPVAASSAIRRSTESARLGAAEERLAAGTRAGGGELDPGPL